MAEVNFAEDAEDDRSSDQNTMAAAAGAAAGGASAGTTDDNNIAVKKYVCDVCEWAQFDTYEETCRHENGCAGVDLSSGTSADADDDSSTESLEDEFDGFIRCLERNFKGTDSIDLDQFSEIKWDDLEDGYPHLKTKEDCEGVINADIARVFHALEKNTVVRKVILGLHCSAHAGECKINSSAAAIIAKALSRNTSVEELEISAPCFLRARGIAFVLEGLMDNISIKKLTITGHYASDIYENYAPTGILGRKVTSILAEFIIKSTSIQELVLEYNPIYWDRCLLILCNALSNNQSIKILSLLGNLFLNVNEIKELCKAAGSKAGIKVNWNASTGLIDLVESCRNISELGVLFSGQNVLNTTRQWHQLSSAFKAITYNSLKGDTSIRSITFCNGYDYIDSFDVQALLVLKSIATSTKVEKLEFRKIPMNDGTMKAICSALFPSKCLREVTFHRCGNKNTHLTVYGANCLADLLLKCENIEGIHLQHGNHQITDEGAINIARAVSDRRGTTRELSLCECGFGNEGGLALRQLLDAPTNTLERLDINCNSFDDPSLIKSFAACLRKSSVLLSLHIGGPREGWRPSTATDVQIHLVSALRDNQLLQRLSLPYSKDTTTEDQKALKQKVIREVLKVNHSIIELCAYEDSYVMRDMLWMNKKNPILASILKKTPFPAYLMKDVSGGVLANALERADDVAGIDGVFSLFRQLSDSIAADENTKKRCRDD